MSTKRIFKLKSFDRWVKGVLSDADLWAAAQQIQRGEFEADLGDGVCKKRVAMPGRGKSGSTRVLVAKESRHAIFFLAGRKKSDAGSDFSHQELAAVKVVAKGIQQASANKLDELEATGTIKEICHES